MQTSITSFFKLQSTTKKRKRDDDDDDDGDDNHEDDTANNRSDDENKCEVVDIDGDKDSNASSKGILDSDTDEEMPTKKKEPAVRRKRQFDSDDDEEDHIPMSKNRKRHVLSSAESTPVKPAAPAKMEAKVEAGDGTAMEDNEPPGQKPSTPAKPTVASALMASSVQSPLLNVDTIIKKKIESGAKALHENIGHTWFKALQGEFDKPYFKKLSTFVEDQRRTNTVYPPADQVFTWTHYHPIRDTRVVIIGQDPYHGPNQAHGLSFSVQKGVAVPKSLINIYKELEADIDNFKHPGHGNLTGWSKQGVLMLNACLTVTRGKPNSHQNKGWETFTDATILWISKNVTQKCVFILWGKFAQQKSKLIDKRHKILTSPHPSPFSADSGFFGCKHFSQTNAYLRSQKLPEIDWNAL